MNASFDARSNREKDPPETDRQVVKAEPDGELIEMGRVSDTQGSWLGSKTDTGNGFMYS